MENSIHQHAQQHHRYTLGVCVTEFIMTFAIHILAPLHMITPAITLTVGSFIIYSAISLKHFRYTLAAVATLHK